MATLLYAAILIAMWTGVLIVLLLLKELGVFERVHKKIANNPKLYKTVLTLADVLYGIGISVVGSVVFASVGISIVSYKLFLGIALISVGAYIKNSGLFSIGTYRKNNK